MKCLVYREFYEYLFQLDTVGSSQGKEMDSSQVTMLYIYAFIPYSFSLLKLIIFVLKVVLDVVRSMLDVLCADENIQGRPKTSENKRRKGKVT